MKAHFLRKLEMECPELMKLIKPDFSDPATYELITFFERHAVRITRYVDKDSKIDTLIGEDVVEFIP